MANPWTYQNSDLGGARWLDELLRPSGMITLSPPAYRELHRRCEQDTVQPPNPLLAGSRSLFGLPVREHPALPVERACKNCQGAGYTADDGTFCTPCKGYGGDRVIGFVDQRPPTFITEPLHAKIPPRFPRSLVAPPRLSRGLA